MQRIAIPSVPGNAFASLHAAGPATGLLPRPGIGSKQPPTDESSSWGAKLVGVATPAVAVLAAGRASGRRKACRTATVRCATLTAEKTKFNVDDITDVCNQSGITLARYMIEMQKQKVVDAELGLIMNSIREATKVIACLIRRAPLQQAELLGLEGEVNVQGEDQKKLDVITNEVLKNALRYTGKLGTMASEEEDTPVIGSADDDLNDEFNTKVVGESGSYICVFDPLDGSSNVDAGVPVGTIFGIFKEDPDKECIVKEDAASLSQSELECLAQTLQPGKNLVAAGYCFYSAATELVVTFGHGVAGFTLDTDVGDFKLTRPSIEIPKRGKIYSCNQANMSQWDEPMRQYINDLQDGKGQTGNKYALRYIGSMVGDVHRTLLYGGIFAYPADKKHKDGKLRLLYEGAPMSFLVEQAGGKSITGHSRVMDIPPVAVHQRVPVILGSSDDIDECYGYFDRSEDPELRARCENRLKGVGA
jgi:fructose-1,6-bisphosphatase I